MKKNIFLTLFLLIIISTIFIPVFAHAQTIPPLDSNHNESNDSDSELNVVSIGKESFLMTEKGVEFDNYITFVSGILALVLFGLVLFTFIRTRNQRLIFVSIAFAVFSIKSFMLTLDLFISLKPWWVDIVAAILDFIILSSFFFGMLKR